MSEIAERLDVGAKAVLGHLLLLEKAGLIEGNVDDQRRKYFHITDNLRLEVFVSPYSFEVETTTIGITAAPGSYVKSPEAVSELKSGYREIEGLLENRRSLMEEYQEVQSNITEVMGRCANAIEDAAEDHIEAEILYALLKGPMSQRVLSMQLGIPEYVLEEYLDRMERKDIIKKDENNYIIG